MGEDDVDDEDESVSDESGDVDGGKVGEDGDGKLHIDESVNVNVANGKNGKSVDDNG